MGKTPDDLPLGVRVAVDILRHASSVMGLLIKPIGTMAVFAAMIGGVQDSQKHPVWAIDLVMMAGVLLATTCPAMKLWANAIEAAHSSPARVEADAEADVTSRLLREVGVYFLLGTCFVMAIGTFISSALVAISMNAGDLFPLMAHGGLTVAAWVGMKRIERLPKSGSDAHHNPGRAPDTWGFKRRFVGAGGKEARAKMAVGKQPILDFFQLPDFTVNWRPTPLIQVSLRLL